MGLFEHLLGVLKFLDQNLLFEFGHLLLDLFHGWQVISPSSPGVVFNLF